MKRNRKKGGATKELSSEIHAIEHMKIMIKLNP
jgi:hypothetical protein